MILSFEQYAALDGINASSIKHGRLSMLHMHHAMTGGWTDPSPAMQRGTHLHGVILEPDEYTPRLNVWTGKVKSGKAWTEWCKVHDQAMTVTQALYDELMRVAEIVHANKDAANLIAASSHEVSLLWEHDDYGKGKARVDGMGKASIFDLKTTGAIEPRRFFNSAYDMGYHIQMGWYCHGVEVLTGSRPLAQVIVLEQKEPHDCYVLDIPDAIISRGMEEAIEIARRYHAHRMTGFFPGVSGGERLTYELPKWLATGETWTVGDETEGQDND